LIRRPSQRLNIIFIVLDSLRADHLGCYGNKAIETPNIDHLARESVLFQNAYPGGLPTLPVRTELFTGQYSIPFRSWQPLTKEDITIAEILSEYGYVSALITDTYHFFKPNMNFHRGFNVFRWIRGQEADAYKSAQSRIDIADFIKPAMKNSGSLSMLNQYIKNVSGRKEEKDYSVAKVIQESIQWLEENNQTKFFLWVDCFDPHEPWDAPPPFDTKYTDSNYEGKKLIHPKYGNTDWLTQEELKYVKGLYAAEVSFVDKWIGHLLNKIQELGLYDNTLIVLLADHGLPLGEHGKILKTPDNLYSELLRIPLLIKLPKKQYAGRKVEPLIQTCDLLPTILEIAGLENESKAMHGKSAWPVITNKVEKIRNYVISGYHETPHRCIRNENWSYIVRPKGQKHELYNLKADPLEKTNLIDKETGKSAEMINNLGKYFKFRGEKETRLLERTINMLQLKFELGDTAIE